MNAHETLARLQFHVEAVEESSLYWCVWSIMQPKSSQEALLAKADHAIAEIVQLLDGLNDIPPADGDLMKLLRHAAHMITEMSQLMLRASIDLYGRNSISTSRAFVLLAWRLQAAFIALLDGDCDDIVEHVKLEERALPSNPSP